ncbi:hypothetical protein GNIT_0942 [Glaciecola nitratireducens FR1064]|uniref:Uncharacterized protein n=1 Tax=Glaciecola nitratireducens (strain JCM 12485 / KCTC 12276 / FR1064) TaxID=1085623 RepID=G4QFY8_GLANF|nr:hypothetical protein GNIT_0942 [Glaciecola nitratireducens FR1064]
MFSLPLLIFLLSFSFPFNLVNNGLSLTNPYFIKSHMQARSAVSAIEALQVITSF